MDAILFFQMLFHGRAIARRKQYWNYYELCRVAAYPSYTKNSQQEIMQYFFDNALSKEQVEDRERVRSNIEEKAKENYHASSIALDFFKSQSRGLYGR